MKALYLAAVMTVALFFSAAPRPRSSWHVPTPSINPIDKVKKQFLYTNSVGGGQRSVRLVLTFKNGSLARGSSASIHIDTNGVVNPVGFDGPDEYHTSTRVMFDDETAASQIWIISDDHTALTPRDPQRFLIQLLRTKKLVVEFSYYEESPQTVTFSLTGLADDMKTAGLHDPTDDAAQERDAGQK